MALAQNNLKRAKDLLAANTISKETYETRNSELLAAQAELLNAKAKLRDAEQFGIYRNSRLFLAKSERLLSIPI
ncbi:MAG: hypothetical protein ACLUKN_05850 [Bacilli bacterium]